MGEQPATEETRGEVVMMVVTRCSLGHDAWLHTWLKPDLQPGEVARVSFRDLTQLIRVRRCAQNCTGHFLIVCPACQSRQERLLIRTVSGVRCLDCIEKRPVLPMAAG
ncbi:MAG: hypothetical protein AB1411_16485 [Nitrospirota bacterium]